MLLMAKQGRVAEDGRQSTVLHTHQLVVAPVPHTMELEWDTRPQQHRIPTRQPWQHQQQQQPPVSFSPPQSMLAPASPPSQLSQRRRSSAANTRPAGPPPNLPIPSLPPSSSLPQLPSAISEPPDVQSYSSGTSALQRAARSSTFVRPSASPNLSAVAAFSQARQASSSASAYQHQSQSLTSTMDDLSDPPPQSYLPPSSSRFSDRNADPEPSNPQPERERTLLAPPTEHSHRSEQRPSSRRALTRALELAREAVQLDSTNESPEAAVNAYAQSVALLSEVMERVRNGEDSTDTHRRRRRRSVAAQEAEVKRLQNIVSPSQYPFYCYASQLMNYLARHLRRPNEHSKHYLQHTCCALSSFIIVHQHSV